jgi:N-formylglutamate deformylase
MHNKMLFRLEEPKTPVPILISSPHSGTEFPAEFSDGSADFSFIPKFLDTPEDTDWHIDRLYDFAPEMGITLINARYSRYVIDLNRAGLADETGSKMQGSSLYKDGRSETSLVPLNTFSGRALYDAPPTETEIERRMNAYYKPYYAKISEILNQLKAISGQVLFFDAHSIKHLVPSIRAKPFSDLILGSNDEKSARPSLISSAVGNLKSSQYSFSHNDPFKGGNLTRSFGNPSSGVHALQLEMCQRVYMDEGSLRYDEVRADEIRRVLKDMFRALIERLQGAAE